MDRERSCRPEKFVLQDTLRKDVTRFWPGSPPFYPLGGPKVGSNTQKSHFRRCRKVTRDKLRIGYLNSGAEFNYESNGIFSRFFGHHLWPGRSQFWVKNGVKWVFLVVFCDFSSVRAWDRPLVIWWLVIQPTRPKHIQCRPEVATVQPETPTFQPEVLLFGWFWTPVFGSNC